jgi:hypothetical protein
MKILPPYPFLPLKFNQPLCVIFSDSTFEISLEKVNIEKIFDLMALNMHVKVV